MKKMEINQCLVSIDIEAFRKGIKCDTGLFIELMKNTPRSLDVVYEEAQKIVNVEKEMRSNKGEINKNVNKPTSSRGE